MRRTKRSDVPVHDGEEPVLPELEPGEAGDSAPESKVPSIGSFIGTAAVIAILVAMIAIALTFNREARQLPLVVALPTLAIAAFIFVRDIVRKRRARSPMDKVEPSMPADADTDDSAEGLSEAKTFGVFGAFILLYLALGFPWGGSLFLFLFLLLIGKVGIIRSLLTTVCVVVPFYVVFVMLFHIPNFSGFLLQ